MLCLSACLQSVRARFVFQGAPKDHESPEHSMFQLSTFHSKPSFAGPPPTQACPPLVPLSSAVTGTSALGTSVALDGRPDSEYVRKVLYSAGSTFIPQPGAAHVSYPDRRLNFVVGVPITPRSRSSHTQIGFQKLLYTPLSSFACMGVGMMSADYAANVSSLLLVASAYAAMTAIIRDYSATLAVSRITPISLFTDYWCVSSA